jgi:hypothetical protein
MRFGRVCLGFNVIKKLKAHLHKLVFASAKPVFSEKVLEIALGNKWHAQKVQSAYTKKLDVPGLQGSTQKIRDLLLRVRTIDSPSKYLICIPNGSCFSGFSRLPNGIYLPEGGARISTFLASDISRSRFHKNRLNLDGDCYYLNDLFSGNYAHWFRDALPRLAMALPYLPSATRFIVDDMLPAFKVDSLSALGIHPDRLVSVRDNYLLTRCERLWYITQSVEDIYNPQAVILVRDALLKYFGQLDPPTGDKIFVSRRNASFKRLANEDELIPILERYKYNIILLENLTLQQQVGLFSKAKSVIGAHGAGLINILFSDSSQLIELEDDFRAPHLFYWFWAKILGHGYSSMTGIVKGKINNDYDIKFTINPDSFEKCLELHLSGNKNCSPVVDKWLWRG